MRQAIFAVAAIFALAPMARADTFTTFDINGLFKDGGAFNGTLLLDTTIGQFTNAHITTGKQEPFQNLPSSWILNLALPGGYFLVGLDDEPPWFFQEFALYLPVSTLTGYNGSAICPVMCGGLGYDSNLYVSGVGVQDAVFLIASGSITPHASTAMTPEPSALTLIGTGLLAMAHTLRRRLT